MAQLINLTHKGAEDLRTFADSMLESVKRISAASTIFENAIKTNATGAGDFSEEFRKMQEEMKKACNDLTEAINPLPDKMKKKADAIDEYLRKQVF